MNIPSRNKETKMINDITIKEVSKLIKAAELFLQEKDTIKAYEVAISNVSDIDVEITYYNICRGETCHETIVIHFDLLAPFYKEIP